MEYQQRISKELVAAHDNYVSMKKSAASIDEKRTALKKWQTLKSCLTLAMDGLTREQISERLSMHISWIPQ